MDNQKLTALVALVCVFIGSLLATTTTHFSCALC